MAKYQMIKLPGGVFAPLNDDEAERLKSFQNNEQYEIEIKKQRNPAFHRKVFAFFNFCFDHWSADKTEWQFQDEQAQFDTFRKNLTVLAGYFDKTYTIKGDVQIEPKSLAYGNMEQSEFERCYNSLINAAMKHIFKGCNDQQILDRLYAFFY